MISHRSPVSLWENGCQGPTLKILARDEGEDPGEALPPRPVTGARGSSAQPWRTGLRQVRPAAARYLDRSQLFIQTGPAPRPPPHLAGITTGRGGGGRAAPHSARRGGRGTLPNHLPSKPRLCFVISNRKRCKFRHRCFKPGSGPFPSPGQGRVAEVGGQARVAEVGG